MRRTVITITLVIALIVTTGCKPQRKRYKDPFGRHLTMSQVVTPGSPWTTPVTSRRM